MDEPLAEDWQAWVRLNVARGCSRESMVEAMVQGGIAEELAHRSIDEASGVAAGVRMPTQAPRPRPSPRVEANRIELDGLVIRVAMEVDRPHVVVYEDLLDAAECSALVALADQRLARSTVVDDAHGGLTQHADRRSTGAFFTLGENELVARIEARIAALLTWPVSHGEGLQVLRYDVGDEYKAHFDYFDPDKPGSAVHLARGGQRVGTLVMFLGDVDTGGATHFPKLGLHVRPQRGTAVYFENADSRGAVLPNSLHAGAPVMRGVKYIATKWLRERAFGEPSPRPIDG
jgi:prolyl 4-hydroxylase